MWSQRGIARHHSDMGSGPSKNKQQALQRQQVSYQTDPVDANTPLARTKGGASALSSYCGRFISVSFAGTFHIAEKGSEMNPDGSKSYVHLPQRNHKDLASRQMDVRRVPGRAARGNGKQVFYIRMKRPTAQLGDTWAQATNEADTLAAKNISTGSPPRRSTRQQDELAGVVSPSAVLASSEPAPALQRAPGPSGAGAPRHSSDAADASDSDAADVSSGWQQRPPAAIGDAEAETGTKAAAQRDLQPDFARQLEATTV